MFFWNGSTTKFKLILETKYWIRDGATKKGTAEETLQLPSLPNSIDLYEFIPEEHYRESLQLSTSIY